MNKSSIISHPLLNRRGTSQRTRIIDALNTSTAPIDGKTLADRLYTIQKYAQHVNYYNYIKNPQGIPYQESGSWTNFFQNSLPFQLANLSKTSVEDIESTFLSISQELFQNPSKQALESLLDTIFRELVTPVSTLFTSVDRNENSLSNTLLATVQTNYLEPLRSLIAIYNASASYLCISKKSFLEYMKAPWQLSIADVYAVDTSIKKVTKGEKEALELAANLLQPIFAQFLKGFQTLVLSASDFIQEALLPLQESLQKRHQPHLALLFTFLELFNHLQGDLNQLTSRHLDFFYQQVLRIVPKPATPDQVHIVFEMAKHLSQYALKEGLLLKNGKDANNQDIQFALDKELVLDKAQVQELRTLYIGEETYDNNVYTEGAYIAPIANSLDGQGKSFEEEQLPNWSTLGAKESKEIINGLATENLSARIGFILSSPVLLLKEGKRTVTIDIICIGNTTIYSIPDLDSVTSELFRIWYSGEKEWLLAPTTINTITASYSAGNLSFRIISELPPDFEPVVFYDQENLQEKLDIQTTYPMVKVELNPEAKINLPFIPSDNGDCDLENNFITGIGQQISAYNFFKGFKIQDATINVAVCGLRNLIVQNDENLLDVNKPMTPFGPRPKVGEDWFVDGGANFFVGSKELLCKNWSKFWINTTWKDKPKNLETLYEFYKKPDFEDGSTTITDGSFRFMTSILQDGVWKKDSVSKLTGSVAHPELLKLFESYEADTNPCDKAITAENQHVSFCHEIERDRIPNTSYTEKTMPVEDLTPLTVDTRKGFFKITLAGVSFQHDRFTYVLTRQMMALADLVDPNSIESVQNDLKRLQQMSSRSDSLMSSINSRLTDIIASATTITGIIDTVIGIISGLGGEFSTISGQLNAVRNLVNTSIRTVAVNVDGDLNYVKNNFDDAKTDPVEEAKVKQRLDDAIGRITNIINTVGSNANASSVLGRLTNIQDNVTQLKDQIFGNGTTIPQGIDDQLQTVKNELDTVINPRLDQIRLIIQKDGENINNPISDEDVDDNLNSFGLWIIIKEIKRRTDAVVDGLEIDTELGIPKEPYTPLIQSLSIDYEASAQMNDMDIVHLYPYENTSKFEEVTSTPYLFPFYENEGTLFLGIDNLTPGGTLSILFQLAEATANSEMDRADITWSYLHQNEWKPLRDGFEIIEDATDGLTVSGIITIAVPSEIKKEGNTMMPDTLYWIRVTTPKDAKAVADTIGIHTQAAKAFAVLGELNDTGRLDTSLSDGSVNKLSEGDFSVKKVTQPYVSFAGRQPEAQGHFYTRVSEQINHKGRTAMISDYEKMVLEYFPDLYKVKCISHTMGLSAIDYRKDLELAPGYIIVTVIPDLTKLIAGNQLEPKVPVSLLEKVANFLRKKSSPFAKLKVMNPRYEYVNVRIEVRLRRGKDENFYKQKLKEDITNLLAPWFLGGSEKIAFGQSVIFSDVVGYVEELDYIDFIKNLILYDQNATSGSEIKPLTARSILTAGIITVEIDKESCNDIGTGQVGVLNAEISNNIS